MAAKVDSIDEGSQRSFSRISVISSAFRLTLHTRLILLGVMWLGLGALVYLLDRTAGSFFWGNVSLHARIGFRIGVLGHWIPTFAHVIAWSLITAGVLRVRSVKGLTAVCLLWLGINAGFEVGQKFAVSICRSLPHGSLAGPVTDLMRGYFLNGTYDTGDLWAAGLGAGLALIWLMFGTGRKE
jgi:hypothetical protein